MHVHAVSSRPLAAAFLAFFLAAAAAPPGHGAPPPAPGRDTSAHPSPSAGVDINTASAEELEAVPGIGKALAQRIVEFREKNGPFGQVDDLLKVRGIGEKSLPRLKPHLTASASKAR